MLLITAHCQVQSGRNATVLPTTNVYHLYCHFSVTMQRDVKSIPLNRINYFALSNFEHILCKLNVDNRNVRAVGTVSFIDCSHSVTMVGVHAACRKENKVREFQNV
jgi:hypothetical protein